MKANLGLADGVVVSKSMTTLGMYANLIPSDLYQSSEAPAAGSKDRTVKPQAGLAQIPKNLQRSAELIGSKTVP